MSEISVASTSDSEAAVREAAGLEPLPPETPEAAQEREAQEQAPAQHASENAKKVVPRGVEKKFDRLTARFRQAERRATEAEQVLSQIAQTDEEGEQSIPRELLTANIQKRFNHLTFRAKEAERRAAELETRLNGAPTNSHVGKTYLAENGNGNGKPLDTNGNGQHRQQAQDSPSVHPAVQQSLEALPNSEEVANVLIANPQLAEHIRTMEPQKAIGELQRLGNDVFLRSEKTRGHNERVTELLNQREDKDEIQRNAGQIILSPVVFETLPELENGPQVAIHLAQHPDEARRLLTMNPRMQLAHLGKLDAKYGKTERPQSSAPPPIKPLSGHSTRSTLPIDEQEYQDFKRSRERQIQENRGGYVRR